MRNSIPGNSLATQDLSPIPAYLSTEALVRERVSVFVDRNNTGDFLDRIVQHIGQTKNNLRDTLLLDEIRKCMDGVETVILSSRPGRETPFECLDTIYLHDTDPHDKMLSFANGYKKLIQDTYDTYVRDIPSDIVHSPRIQKVLSELLQLAHMPFLDNPYEYFHKTHNPTPQERQFRNDIMHRVMMGR